MIVAFWNRLKSADASRQADWLASGCDLCPAWDVLLLAEVTERAATTFEDRLGDAGDAASWVANGSTGRRPHGLMAISRIGPLSDVRFPSSAPKAKELPAQLAAELDRRGDSYDVRQPLPERWLTAQLEVDGKVLSLAGAQMPYAAGRNLGDTTRNRLAKREAYRQLSGWAQAESAAGRNVVLGMDGNNWHDWTDISPEETPGPKRYRSDHRRLLDEAHLFDHETNFHGRTPEHGLVDSLRVATACGNTPDPHGNRELARRHRLPLGSTHLLAKDAPRMDRLYVSPKWSVRQAGICHGAHQPDVVAALTKRGERICCGSDHALVWADLAF